MLLLPIDGADYRSSCSIVQQNQNASKRTNETWSSSSNRWADDGSGVSAESQDGVTRKPIRCVRPLRCVGR